MEECYSRAVLCLSGKESFWWNGNIPFVVSFATHLLSYKEVVTSSLVGEIVIVGSGQYGMFLTLCVSDFSLQEKDMLDKIYHCFPVWINNVARYNNGEAGWDSPHAFWIFPWQLNLFRDKNLLASVMPPVNTDHIAGWNVINWHCISLKPLTHCCFLIFSVRLSLSLFLSVYVIPSIFISASHSVLCVCALCLAICPYMARSFGLTDLSANGLCSELHGLLWHRHCAKLRPSLLPSTNLVESFLYSLTFHTLSWHVMMTFIMFWPSAILSLWNFGYFIIFFNVCLFMEVEDKASFCN